MAKVLVIDDESDVLLLCRVNLEQAGHEVLVTGSGAAGVELAFAERPDIIVLDLMMPTMDGFDVLEVLADDERTRNVPVLILSALASRVDQVQGLRAGAAGYVTKPFTPTTLTEDVARLERMTLSERGLHRAEALRRLLGEGAA